MPHRIAHTLDTLITFGSIMLTASAGVLLNDPEHSASNAVEVQLLLLPLIGSSFACGALILLNPAPETRRIVIGRAIAALLFGVTLPQVIGMLHPSLEHLSVKPVVLVLSGALFSSIAYVLSKSFTREMYARADGIAKREAERLEKKYSPEDPKE